MEKTLAQLRTELDRLRKRECELLQELFDVRATAKIQSKKIDNIIKMQPVSAIDRLPVEVLSRILHFALCVAPSCSEYEWGRQPRRKQQFAGVSCRWRNVILNSPSFWSVIYVGLGWTSSYVKLHVKRSREHLLDITIGGARDWWSSGDSILRCAHRWRSLTVYFDVPLARLLDLSRLSLPRLECVNVQNDGDAHVKFPTIDNTPVLERLILKRCRPPITILPSLEKLTALALCGEIEHWTLDPQSIRLPLLRSLTIDVDNPSMLLKAIVAPELSRFDFGLCGSNSPFDANSSVFNKVHYIRVRSAPWRSVATVCLAFPNVRHLEMGESALGFFNGLREKADLWGDLECITFRSLQVCVLQGAVKTLQGWLRQRKPTAKPLHVKFKGIKHGSDSGATGHILSMLYNSLHKDCTFEVDQFPLVERTRVTFLTRILHMNLPEIPPCIANMHQDVPWRESTDDFQDELEDDSSDDDTEYDTMDDMYSRWDDSNDDYGVQ